MSNVTTPKKRMPKVTSDKKRPNKTFIMKMVEFRGHMTGNERTQLKTLEVKNALQRINSRAMSDDVTSNFDGTQNGEIQSLIKEFIKNINAVLAA